MRFLEEFFYEEAGGEAGGHFQEAGAHFAAAREEVVEDAFQDVGRPEAFGELRYAAAHMLFVYVVLVFQVANRLP